MARRSFYLGRYNCVELLSEGPLGESFRAKIYGVAGFEKQFVVRRIPMALCSDDAFARRLVDAATRYAAIDSDRVARVHDVNVQGSQYYIAVDLIRGVDLATLKRSLKEKNERLSSEAALLVALELAETIAQLHARQDLDTAGIRHLGLSPDTVVATPEGELRLLDVGLMEALITPGWALADRGVATLQYLAPEVLRGESTAGTADIFSIGVILYELLTGDAPYNGADGAELVAKMQAGPPQPKYLDPRSATVLSRALAANPAQRFPTMEALAEALRTLLVPRVQRARNDLGTQVRRLLGRPTMRLGSGSAATPNAEQPPLAALKPSSPFSPQKTPPPLIPNSRLPKPPPPRGPSLEPVPPRNTFAGVGADDAAISIEMSELPGPMTEKAMPVFVEPNGDKGTHSSPTAHSMPAVPMPINDRTEPMVRVPEDELVDDGEPTEKMNSDRHQMPPALPTPPVGTPLPTYGNLTGPLPMLVPDAQDASKEIEIEPERMRKVDIDVDAFPSTMRVAPIKRPAPKRSPWPLFLVGAIGLGAAGGTGFYLWKKQQSAVVQPTSKPLDSKPVTADPKPVAADPKPVAADPKPVAADPKPVAADPKPVAADPKPAAADPKPVAADPKPVAADPKPAAAATTRVATTPAGATVFLGGKQVGVTPLELPNSSGELIVVAEGYRVHKQLLNGRGTTYDVALTPAKLSNELAGGAGLKVRCKTAGVFRIFVDGQDTGMTCPNETRISIKAGAHKIGLFSPTSGATTETSANVKGGSSSTRLYVKN